MSRSQPRVSRADTKRWSANSSGLATVTGSSYSSETDNFHRDRRSRLESNDRTRRSRLESNDRSVTSTVADIATRPAGLSAGMMDSLINLADHTGKQLVYEAHQSLQTPMRRKNVEMIGRRDGVVMFKCLPPPPPPAAPVPPPAPATERHSRSLWQRLTFRRKRPAPKAAVPEPQPVKPVQPFVPRVFGLSQVHVSMEDLVDLIGHRSPHSSSLLHPGMKHSPMRHTLIDLVDEYACLRSVTMLPTGNTSEPREFLMVEYHHSFKTASGKNGYVVAFHSVSWPGGPQPPRGAVRGSMYNSGLVALESEVYPDRVDLYCVAEQNLKGDALDVFNYEASRHRVQGTLSRITLTIEERAKMLLSLDHTRVFQKARRVNEVAKVETCTSCKDRIGKLPPNTEPYMCRKCYAPVCGECSSIWQAGQRDMRLCMECWADATLNRTESTSQSMSIDMDYRPTYQTSYRPTFEVSYRPTLKHSGSSSTTRSSHIGMEDLC